MANQPLADRMRPKTFDEVSGQTHLVGKNGIIRKLIDSGRIPNMIFFGPPGTGKTTVVRALIHIFESMDMKVALAAPTGRAAKRLSESTAHEAKTIQIISLCVICHSSKIGFKISGGKEEITLEYKSDIEIESDDREEIKNQPAEENTPACSGEA